MATRKQKEKRQIRYTSAKERAEKHESGFEPTSLVRPEGKEFFKFKRAGVYRIDVIPYIVGKGNPWADEGMCHYERTYWVHRGIGADSQTYCCLKKTFGKKCPICEEVARMKRDPGADRDAIKELEPKERQLWNVIDLNDSGKGVQLLDQSHFLFGKAIDNKIKDADEEDNYANFAHLEDGLTLKLSVVEESFGGRSFYKVVNVEMKPRKKAYGEDILDDAICLDECLKELEYDELKTIFLQEDVEEASSSKKPKAGPKPKKKEEDDEEDEDEDLDEEEEEEEDDEDVEEEDDEEDVDDDEDDDSDDDDDADDDDDVDDDEDEEDDEEEEEDDEEDEDEDDDDEEEDEKPAPKKRGRKPTKK